MFRSLGQKLLNTVSAAALALTIASALPAQSQTSLVFPSPKSADWQDYIVENVGVSPFMFQSRLWIAYTSNNINAGQVCLTGTSTVYPFSALCPNEVATTPTFPNADGVAQATVWNGKIYLAFARLGDHQLVIASSSDGAHFTWTLPGFAVGVSPAIAVIGTQLFVAYQENASDHYLGIAKSSDGVTFTNQISTVYKIGHAPGMAYFNGQLVIAAFCQCDSHYLDIYTTTGSLTPTFATEDTSKTLSNASQPSLAVYNNVLLLGYMQNGQRYFQTATSYDAIHWTAAVRQTSLTNGWNGLGVAVVGSNIYGVYESQNAIAGDPNSAANEFAYSITTNVH